MQKKNKLHNMDNTNIHNWSIWNIDWVIGTASAEALLNNKKHQTTIFFEKSLIKTWFSKFQIHVHIYIYIWFFVISTSKQPKSNMHTNIPKSK
jgi:hypothetical protein